MMHSRIRYLIGLFLVASLLVVTFTALFLPVSRADGLRTIQLLQSSSPALQAQQPITYQINDIVGATYDPATRDLIIIGQLLDADLPMMDYEYVEQHLLASLRAVHETSYSSRLGDPLGPAVTIDPVPNDITADHEVKFFGNIANTHYGYAFFEADRLLKTYTLGKDNLNPNQPFLSSVSGYSSYFDRLVSLKPEKIGNLSVRWWFTPSLNLRASPSTSQTIVFSNTRVVLNRELTGSGISSKEIQAANDFVAHFNKNYSLFASEQYNHGNDTLYELPQLYKLYGVAYWTWAASSTAINVSGANQGWLNHYPISQFTTPKTTPVISRSDEGLGLIIYGGVGTKSPETIVPDPFVSDLGARLLADRPSPETMAWLTDPYPPDHNPTAKSRNSIGIAMAFRLSTNLITDGSFDGITDEAWTQFSSGNFYLITNDLPHWGDYGLYLGGYSTADDSVWQQVTIPSDATDPRLSYYWLMDSDEPSLSIASISPSLDLPPSYLLPMTRPSTGIDIFDSYRSVGAPLTSTQAILASTTEAARDFLYIEIRDVNNNPLETLRTISNNDIRQYWQVDSFSLKAYLGQTIRVMLRSTNDNNGRDTSFLIDDVSLDIIAAPSTPTATPSFTPTSTPTVTPTNTSTATATPTFTPTSTPTSTPTATPQSTITPEGASTPLPDNSQNNRVLLPVIRKQ